MANVFEQFGKDVNAAAAGGNVQALPNQPAPATTDGSAHAGVMEDAGQRWGIPQGLMSALMSKESSGNAGAVSSKGAIGLGQVMPATAQGMGYNVDELRNNPAMQADASAQYLSQMYNRYGDWRLALQAYHDGPGNVDAMLKGNYTPGPEGANYVDSRFDQWTNGSANGANSVEPTQHATSAKAGGNVFAQFGEYSPARADENQAPPEQADPAQTATGDQPATAAQPAGAEPSPYADYQRPTTLGEDLADVGKGFARAATNVLNIPIDVANMTQSGVTWLANQAGIGDGTYNPIPRGGIPGITGDEDMSEGARLGADIISAFTTLPGGAAGAASKAPAVARELAELAGTASPEVASILQRLGGFVENRIAAPAARATPGAIAASGGDEDKAAIGIAAGPIGEGLANGIGAGVRRAAPVVSDVIDKFRPAPEATATGSAARNQAARDATEQQIGDAAAEANRRFTQRATVETRAADASNPAEPVTAPQAAIDLANAAQVDKAVLRSAGALGMSDALTPAAYARDPSFRQTVQALASRKGSLLQAKEVESVGRLADQADQLIKEAGGDASAVGIDQAFRQQVKQTIDNLGQKADDIYNTIGTKIPKQADVDPVNTLGYLWQKADDLRGIEHLSSAEKKALDWLQPVGDAAAPTYARIDTLRKQVGQAINKKSGPFKDEEAGALKQLYGRLTEDQEAVAARYGADQEWTAGKQLVQRRKELEEQAIGALGKDLDGSVTSKAQNAILALGRKGGDPKAWNDLIRATPESMRGQVVANALQRTFTAGSRKEQSLSIPGFVDWYNTARANGTLSNVMQHLPRELRARYGHIARVANGIRRAQSDTVTTGSINDFVKRFDQADGALGKLYGTAGTIAQHAGAFLTLGPMGNLAVEAGRTALKNRVARSTLADNLLASNQFNQLLQAAAKGDAKAVRSAENNVTGMKDWKEFVTTLPEAEKEQIGRVGVAGWLTSGQQASGAN